VNVAATETPTPAKEAPKAPPSVADMTAFLRADEGADGSTKTAQESAAPEASEAPAPSESATPETAEAQAEVVDEEALEKKEEEEAAKSGRPSRWQRQKAKIAHLDRAVVEARAKEADALKLANELHLAYQHTLERMRVLEERAKAAGVSEDPRDVALRAMQLQEAQRQLGESFAQQQARLQAEAQVMAQKDNYKEQFATEAAALSRRHGVDSKALLSGYAVALEASLSSGTPEPTLQEVAATLASLANVKKNAGQHEAARAQLAVSSSAPRTLRPTSTKDDLYPATIEGMAAFLKASKG